MTNVSTKLDEVDLFETPFSTGATVFAAISFVVAILFGWTGIQNSELLIVGTELNIVSGMAGLVLLGSASVTLLVAAIYMEPGFDH